MPEEYDMDRLREDAARRMREMQARAGIPSRSGGRARVPSAPAGPEVPPASPEHFGERQEQPPEFPAEENSRDGSSPDGSSRSGSSRTPPETPMELLFRDRERTLILALLLLLCSDDGDRHELLFALMFLLM